MSLKTKRLIALGICLVLLAAAIFQNIRNNKDKAAGKDDDKKGLIVNDLDDYLDETILDAEEFFAGARLERESKRSLLVAECAAVIDDTESSEEEKVQAMELKDAIEMMIELESDMETAIKGRGYEEVIVELDEDGYIYVTVMAEELTEQEVMVLAGIAIDTTGATLDQIVVKNIS